MKEKRKEIYVRKHMPPRGSVQQSYGTLPIINRAQRETPLDSH